MHAGGAELWGWGWGYRSDPSVKESLQITGPDFNKTGKFNIVPTVHGAKHNL